MATTTGKIAFKGTLEPSDGWVCLVLPKGVSEKLGSRSRVPIVGTVNGFPIRTSVFPRGDGTHSLMVNKAMQDAAGVRLGDRVTVVLEVDAAPRVVTVPADLRKALARSKKAKAAFERLSYTHRKEYVA